MSAQKQFEFVSEAEYWAGEEISPTKHEYFNGRVYAMAESSYNHATICGNVFATAKSALRGHPCKARTGEVRVKVETTGLNIYPDALIFCPPARFEGTNDHTLLTPKVIFVVLSNSTEGYDRGEKFLAYRQIDTLTDYVLIDQDRVKVEHFRWTDAGWLLNTFLRRDDVLHLEDLNVSLPLDLIYEELDLPEVTISILRVEEQD